MTKKSLNNEVAGLARTPSLIRFRSEMEDLFDDLLKGFIHTPSETVFNDIQSTASYPKINVSETETGYGIEIAVAGFSKDEVKLELKENMLLISADKKEVKEEENKIYLRKEISSRAFARGVRFTDKITTSGITADYVDGIIYVSVPKEISPPKQNSIEIKIS